MLGQKTTVLHAAWGQGLATRWHFHAGEPTGPLRWQCRASDRALNHYLPGSHRNPSIGSTTRARRQGTPRRLSSDSNSRARRCYTLDRRRRTLLCATTIASRRDETTRSSTQIRPQHNETASLTRQRLCHKKSPPRGVPPRTGGAACHHR